jgi:hypothetical protein
MKKLLPLVCLSLFMIAAKAYGQSIWTIKDNVQKGYFKTNTTFHTHIGGFSSKAQADAVVEKIKAIRDVSSVEVSNADANGNCDLKLIMQAAHNKKYYLGVAQKLGIQYVEVNGTKKTPAQWLEEAEKK